MGTRTLLLSAVLAAALGTTAGAHVERYYPPIRPPGDYVWVAPVYRIEYEKVWVPTRVERIPERVWVPGTSGWRTVIYYDEYGNRIERREWCEITPGHWETRYREVVVEGHYETRERRVLVSPGYWQYVGPGPTPPAIVEPPVWRNPPTVGVEGYSKTGSEADKGKFSPLYEWPK